MPAIVLFFGGKTLRDILTDVRWRWTSDANDAEQKRRHEDEDHRLDLRRRSLELEREFPESAPRFWELESRPARPELPPPSQDDANDAE